MAETDLISRQAAIDAIHEDILLKPHNDSWFRANHEFVTVGYVERTLLTVPSAQPDRDVIDDCLCHIYKNISVHTATGGVIAIRYYMEKLYEEIYGKGERPWWMT